MNRLGRFTEDEGGMRDRKVIETNQSDEPCNNLKPYCLFCMSLYRRPQPPSFGLSSIRYAGDLARNDESR